MFVKINALEIILEYFKNVKKTRSAITIKLNTGYPGGIPPGTSFIEDVNEEKNKK